jgi:hypothetical protein
MTTAQKTRKVIIIAAVSVQVITATCLQAAEPCRPDGFCPLPGKETDQKAALRAATKRAALKNMLKKQFNRCDSFVGDKLAAALGQMNEVREQIILKALETGLLLQLPDIVKEVARTQGNDGGKLCGGTFSSGQHLSFSGNNFISSES